jgi:hypothetical protein
MQTQVEVQIPLLFHPIEVLLVHFLPKLIRRGIIPTPFPIGFQELPILALDVMNSAI